MGAAGTDPDEKHVAGARLDDQIVVVSGRWDGENTAAVEAYDPAADSWEQLPPLSIGRGGFGAAVIDGELHAVGGEHPGTVAGWTTGAHERYDPERGAWERLDDAPLPVHGNAVVSTGDRLYVVGGAWRQGLWSVTSWSDRVFAFDPAEGAE